MTPLPIGVRLPVTGPVAGRDALTAVAARAEQLGFTSAWASEHVLIPATVRSRYPGTPDGSFPFRPDHPWLDPLTALSWVAAVAPRLIVGTCVLVLGLHHPIVLAKQVATLDVLSDGRLILGLGLGWMREEFDLLGASFDDRAARTDEAVALMRALWSDEPVRFVGHFWSVSDAAMRPLPTRRSVPVIWGGESRAALRRVARLGDGWISDARDAPALAKGTAELRRLCEDTGRDPATVQVWAKPGVDFRADAERVEELAAAGATGIVVDAPRGADLAATLAELDRVAEACGLRAPAVSEQIQRS